MKTHFPAFINKAKALSALAILLTPLGLLAQTPAISSVTPNVAGPGGSVTITGSNFNDTLSKNIVYFGATMGTVTAASATSLTVTVPTGATRGTISVLNTTHHLHAYEQYDFLPTYNNACFATGDISYATGLDLATGVTPYLAAIGDLDGDGKPDVAVLNHQSNTISVFRNISSAGSLTSASFAAPLTFTVDGYGTNIKIADVDGDGKPELLSTHTGSARIDVYRNTSTVGAISFATKINITVGITPTELIVADFDGDGKPDMATASELTDSVTVVRNVSSAGVLNSASFSAPVAFATGHGPLSLYAADVDGDGKQDILVTNDSVATVSVLRNATAGPGAFSAASFNTKVDFAAGIQPFEIQAADIDGDGKPDMIVANNVSNTVSVYRNTATAGSISAASFAAPVDYPTAAAPTGLTIGDMDGDGKADIAVVSNIATGIVTIYRNTAVSGSITATSLTAGPSLTAGAYPVGISMGDLDGDTKPDIIVANGVSNNISIFRNDPSPVVAAIAGPASVCQTGTATYTDPVAGGIWSLTNTTIATIDPATGVLTGSTTGTDTVIYTVVCTGDSSHVILPVTLTPPPAIGVVTGPGTVCISASITLTDTTAGGTWTSSNPTIASVSAAGIVTGGTTGTATLTYTVNEGCTITSTHNVTVITTGTTGPISGPTAICSGSATLLSDTTSGGVWTSSNTAVATVDATGHLNAVAQGSATISYYVSGACSATLATLNVAVASPADTITGPSAVCIGAHIILGESTTGGTWTSGTPAIATISGDTVHGVASGTSIISYTVTNICGTTTATQAVTVNPAPFAGTISGPATVCAGASITLTDAATGGTWGSTSAHASVNTSGVVNGVTAGSATIYYVSTTACGTDTATYGITIDPPFPTAGNITGTNMVCDGSTITLADTASGGTWSSSVPTVATISPAGVVTGTGQGTTIVAYTVTNTCGTATDTMTVIGGIPAAAVAGGDTVCHGDTIVLSDAAIAGVWSTSNAAVATISATGVVTGAGAGNVTISYTVQNGCGTSYALKVITVISTAYCDSILSVRQPAAALNTMSVYPNPNNGSCSVQVNTASDEVALLTITDVTGRKVLEQPYQTNTRMQLDLNESAGIYFLQVTTSREKFMTKLLVTQ